MSWSVHFDRAGAFESCWFFFCYKTWRWWWWSSSSSTAMLELSAGWGGAQAGME